MPQPVLRSLCPGLLLIFSTCGTCCLLSSPAVGQITPDNSLGVESSFVTPDFATQGERIDRIDGGAIRGNALFHSFTDFNVNGGQRVFFANPEVIDRIFSRVTGGSASEIFGTLGVLGNADLYLINPSGVYFGPDAQLDIRGSFVGSTTDSLLLDPANLPTNDITAISRENPSLEGQVQIFSPDTDPSQGLDALPENVIDASRLIAQGCASGNTLAQEIGSLVITGRGGLPANPRDSLTGSQLLLDWATVEADGSPAEEVESTASAPMTPHQLQEVQSLALNSDGRVILMAQANGSPPHIPSLTCAGEVVEE